MKLFNELMRAVRNRKYETTDAGMYFPVINMEIGGYFDVQVNDGPVEVFPNLVVDQWRVRALEILFLQATPETNFYLAPYSANVTPLATWTAANFTSNSTEFTNYTEAGRQIWTVATVDAFSVSNTASKAVFTVAAGAGNTIWGVGLLTQAAKSSTLGHLVAANRSPTSRTNLVEDDEVTIGYTINLNAS